MAVLTIGAPAWAHHSLAMFDIQHSLTLSGTVESVRWANPHVSIDLVVPDLSGRAAEWTIEAPSPLALKRWGWKRKSVKAGDKADFQVHQARDESLYASLMSVSVDGKVIKPPD